MDSAVKLIEALAKLFGSLAWPLTVAVVVLVVLGRHRGAVNTAIDRVEKIVAPGGVEVALREVVKEHEQQVVEKAVEVAKSDPADRNTAVEMLVAEALHHNELVHLVSILQDESQPMLAKQVAREKVRDLAKRLRELHQQELRARSAASADESDNPKKPGRGS